MANIIKPKRSTVAAKVPTTAQMSSGEIAVNSTDQKIYTYDGTSILQIGAGKLSGLGDVALTGLTSGQTVQWNGTNWINTTPATTDTASQILTKLLTVDGAGSGLDADLLDGLSSTSYVQTGSVIMNTNPFGGRQLYINSIDNAMYAANKKWYVTVTTHLVTYLAETYPKLNPAYVASYTVGGSGTSFTVTDSPADIVVYNNDVLCAVSASPSTQYNYSYSGGTITFGATVTGTIYVYPESTLPQYLDSPVVSTLDSNLPFDGSYDSQTTIPVGHYAKIRVVPSSDAKGGFPGYPYGQYFLSYYYSSTPDRAECRTYNRNFRPHTIGWKLASFTDYIGNNAGAGYIQSVTDSGNFGRTIVEFIVFAHASHSTALSEIDWKLDRPNLSTTGATVTKFGSNKLYADLTFGNQTTNTISLSATTGLITGSQFSSTVATGTAPLIVASTTRVSNLNVATAGTSDALNTANNYQVNSIGIGAAASAVAGRINSTTAIITPNITGVSTGLTVVNGDITAYRSGGTTGVLYLNSAGTRYLYWDGTNYNMPGGPVVATNITAAGNITGTATNVTGTVALANGGTGATDAATARTNLGAYAASNPSGYTTNTGTVTSVAALTLGTAGTDVASTVATGTTTPVITLNIPTASATNRGALSSTDWSTFNNKQAALVSGTNIKTVNGTSLLGSGDLVIAGGGGTSVTTGTAAPGTATAGDLWWNSEEGKLKIYYNDGDTSQWVDSYIGVKGDTGDTGPQGIQGIQGDPGDPGAAGVGIPVGGTAGQALVKTSATDYDDVWTTLNLMNLPDAWVKKACRVATTANITLSGTQTIDGIAVVAGDRVLVKNQTTASQNGIYDVAAGSWTRSLDANTASYIAGALVSIDLGTVNGGKVYDTDFKSTDTIGTTAITWNRMVDNSSLALYYRKNTSTTLSSSTSAQSWLGLTNGVTVAANTIYAFEGFFELTTSGTTSHTEGLLFGLSSATVTNITWHVTRYTNSTTATAPLSNTFTAATTSVVTGAITTAQDVHYRIRGTVAIGTGGNFNPQIIFSAAPGGTSTVSLGAYFEMTPIGTTGGNVSNGTWS